MFLTRSSRGEEGKGGYVSREGVLSIGIEDDSEEYGGAKIDTCKDCFFF